MHFEQDVMVKILIWTKRNTPYEQTQNCTVSVIWAFTDKQWTISPGVVLTEKLKRRKTKRKSKRTLTKVSLKTQVKHLLHTPLHSFVPIPSSLFKSPFSTAPLDSTVASFILYVRFYTAWILAVCDNETQFYPVPSSAFFQLLVIDYWWVIYSSEVSTIISCPLLPSCICTSLQCILWFPFWGLCYVHSPPHHTVLLGPYIFCSK